MGKVMECKKVPGWWMSIPTDEREEFTMESSVFKGRTWTGGIVISVRVQGCVRQHHDIE
jgi:hypothetical protein